MAFIGTCRFRKLDSCISMVKPAKDRMRDNLSEPLDRTCVGRVLPKRNVSSRLIIIGGVFFKNPPKVFDVEHDQMICALASDRSDQAFDIPILPGRAERRGPVPDPHRPHASFERAAECSVIVANEIFRCAVPGECLGNLARQPLRCRVSGHRNPQQPPPSVAENEKCK